MPCLQKPSWHDTMQRPRRCVRTLRWRDSSNGCKTSRLISIHQRGVAEARGSCDFCWCHQAEPRTSRPDYSISQKLIFTGKDESGEELSTGQNGLVYFERDVIPFEYHSDEEKTRSTQHAQHPMWTSVGDIGHVDGDGFLFLTDRKAFMIISGGLNIYPQEVENALALHPAISDIAVIGVPDHRLCQVKSRLLQGASISRLC